MPPSSWTAPAYKSANAMRENTLVQCGACRRKQSADMVVDVRALPAAVRGEAEFICDACVSSWIRNGRCTRETLYVALGAPVAVVAKMVKLDAALGTA